MRSPVRISTALFPRFASNTLTSPRLRDEHAEVGIKEEDVPEPGASDQVSTIDMIEDHARFYLAGDGGSPVRINVKMARSLAAIGCAKLVLVETA
jgi:hypothetical protein